MTQEEFYELLKASGLQFEVVSDGSIEGAIREKNTGLCPICAYIKSKYPNVDVANEAASENAYDHLDMDGDESDSIICAADDQDSWMRARLLKACGVQS